jgi:WD40 repeat protein
MPTATPTETATPTPVPTAAATPTPKPTATPLPNSVLQIGLDFAPDGAVFAAGGETILVYKDARFLLLQATDGAVLADFELPREVIAFEVAANKPLLAAAVANADGGSDVELYDITSGTLLVAIPNASQAAIAGVRFSGDDTTLITTAPDRKVRLWNAADGSARGAFEAQKDTVTCMAMAPNGQTIVTGSYASDGSVNAWSTGGDLVNTLMTTNPHCYLVAFSPDSAWLLYHNRENMSLYSTSDWSRLWYEAFTGHQSPKINLPERNAMTGFTPDGRLFLGSPKGTVVVMNLADLAPVETFELGSLASFSFAPDGRTLLVARSNRLVEILDLTLVP